MIKNYSSITCIRIKKIKISILQLAEKNNELQSVEKKLEDTVQEKDEV